MFEGFLYEPIPLSKIRLDLRNPRIVTRDPPKNQEEVLAYLFAHEDLLEFIKLIVVNGKNQGAERPYVIPDGNSYIVVEGNTRIAAYRVLCGLDTAPQSVSASIPKISAEQKRRLSTVDCTIAPQRGDLLQIMAKSHFGQGDKSKWGYLGSRKAVHDDYESGIPVHELAKAFGLPKGSIRTLILEYKLYLEALKLNWNAKEREALADPGLEFNPPIRFLQGKGHKEAVGIDMDRASMAIVFDRPDARSKFKHLVRRLVISPEKGLGATASYDKVFENYAHEDVSESDLAGEPSSAADEDSDNEGEKQESSGLRRDALFNYPVRRHSQLLRQLMKEARTINAKSFPASATFLLRNIVEVLFKEIVEDHKLNPGNKRHDIESACNTLIGAKGVLPSEEVKVLKEFSQQHISHLNLGAHGNVVPNKTRLMSARDCIDQFVKKHV